MHELIDPKTRTDIPDEWKEPGGIVLVREVPGQGVCVLQHFIFTCGLLTNVTFPLWCTYDFAARYCYESFADAKHALATWDGKGDPPGPWVKEKLSERRGPGAKNPDLR